MHSFHFYKKHEIIALTTLREGEIKLGETVEVLAKEDTGLLSSSRARFVLLGLPESIGVKANGGIGGAETAWPAFLKAFLNLQETPFLSGKDFLLPGHFDFGSLTAASGNASLKTLREHTTQIDDMVFPLIERIVAAGKIPIVIGGGHNNAFPLLKGSSLALQRALNVINLDAHSDFRAMEGRHSGNGFRYAYEEGFLKKYALPGLHEAYNSAGVIAELKQNEDFLPIFWEDIFLRKKTPWQEALSNSLAHVHNSSFGIELDLDCIENTLSSAATPVGIAAVLAMDYCYQAAQNPHAVYLHLPEGIVERSDGLSNPFTGKLLSYLVQAFCKGVLERG